MSEGYVMAYIILSIVMGLSSAAWYSNRRDERNPNAWFAFIPFGVWMTPAVAKVYTVIMIWAVAT